MSIKLRDLENKYKEVRSFAEKFAEKEVAPLAAEIDKKGKLPEELIKKLAENGLLGVFVPEELGGAGMDFLSYSIIVEEISKACGSTGVFVSAHNSLCIYPILIYGNDEQKKKYLPLLASGEKIGCFCLSEPNAGSDAGSLTTKAELEGNNYLISGTKNFITNGKEADVAIVFAKTKKTDNHKGISAFIVDTKQDGFSILKLEDKLGIRGSSTAQIALDRIIAPKENLLGAPEKGFRVAMGTLDGGRIGIAAQALGIARAAFEYAARYAKERVQFNAPIANLQGIQFILADMSTKVDASWCLIERASKMKDQGLDYTCASAQAKLFAAEASMWVTTKAIQVCGGNGYTKEYPVERFFRDAKITEIYEGTSEVQRLVIAANVLKML